MMMMMLMIMMFMFILMLILMLMLMLMMLMMMIMIMITRFTRHVRVVEPLIIFSSAYFAFLGAELFHWSGIISIIAYGITVKRY